MFRASDIFGKRSGNNSDALREKARAQTENAGEKKRPADAGPATRSWDPATGQMIEEDLPPEIQEMMGIKKPKVEPPARRPGPPERAMPVWQPGPPQIHYHQPMRPQAPPPPPPPMPMTMPVPGTARPAEPLRPPKPQGPPAMKVTMGGFRKAELNGYYSERPEQEIQGRASFWSPNMAYFIYWQRSLKRWAICDAGSVLAARTGSNPGWAYRSDPRHFVKANDGWIEAIGSEWQSANVVCTVLEGNIRDDDRAFAEEEVSAALKVKFTGFQKQELNTTFEERPDDVIQGKASLWDPTKSMFMYWQQAFNRWAICGASSLSSAKSGMAPGWAYRSDSKHFTEVRGGWMEYANATWQPAKAICVTLQGQASDAADPAPVAKAEASASPAPKQAEAPHISELTVEQYQVLVRRVYEEKNKDKLPDLPYLFQKYAGREKEFFTQVCDKYDANTWDLIASLSEPKEPRDVALAEVPNLSAREYVLLVQGIYVKHNPEKLSDLARLMAKFKDSEKDFYVQVCEKYGLNPTTFHKEEGKALLAAE